MDKLKFHPNELKANFIVRCVKHEMNKGHSKEIAVQIAHDVWNERLEKYRKDSDKFIYDAY